MRLVRTLILGVVLTSLLGAAHARFESEPNPRGDEHAGSKRRATDAPARFRRIATLPNYRNDSDTDEPTVSEIVASTSDGDTLVYTDGPRREIGFVHIAEPSSPVPLGKLGLAGEPTSVAVHGDRLALVAVNTRTSFEVPSGHLAIVDIEQREILAQLALGGQPDSLAISPDGAFAAVAIENERDEERVVDGVEGGLPQAPAGFLVIVDLLGDDPLGWRMRRVDLGGLAEVAPDDPEPEFVDINTDNEAVVTLQENNHVAIVDLASGVVVSHFSAGRATLDGVDLDDDGVIAPRDLLVAAREPDAVTWLPAKGGGLIATANEGDYSGGSRGFTLFDRHGRVRFDSESSLEAIAIRHGHYPEARSDAKGIEPESIEHGRFAGKDYLFVGSERGSFVAVYELDAARVPRFVQLLPAPLAPEGVHAIPERNLLVVSGEEDAPPFGVRSTLMIYELSPEGPSYPDIVSDDDRDGEPIAWAALSGLSPVPGRPDELLAVWDSFFTESRILTLDIAQRPARIRSSTVLTGGRGDYDPEGIAHAPDGTWWIASEGNSGGRPNLLVQVDASGRVLWEVGLPAEIEACRAASSARATLGAGFEGVAIEGHRHDYTLLVAQQRGWDYTSDECEALDDDFAGGAGGEPSHTRLWRFDPSSGAWSHVAYELEPLPPRAGWVGLSEISAVRGGYLVLERDDRSGDYAELKSLVFVRREALDDGVVTCAEKRSIDLIPELLSTQGWISDKPEGVAVTGRGDVLVVTDNDGVDDWSGETRLLRLGSVRDLFR